MIFSKLLKKVFSVCALFIALPLTSSAQSYSQMKFGIEDGLLYNRVDCLVQDSLGYIWISNGLGLSRYDGTRFVNFKPEEPYSNIFGKIAELHLLKDKSIIYPVTAGITRFREGKFSFSKIDTLALMKYDRKGMKAGMGSEGLFDKWGNMWCMSGVLYKFNGTSTEKITDKNLPSFKDFKEEFIDEEKNFWIVAKDGFHKFNGNSFEWIKVKPDSNYYIFSAFTDKMSRVWFLGHPENDWENVSVFLFEKGEIKKLYLPFREYGSFNGGIGEDEKGDVWLSCANGLVKFHGHYFEREGIAKGIKKILIDKRQNIIGYNSKQIFVKSPGGISEIKIDKNFENDFTITGVIVDIENIIWVGTTDGLLKLNPTNVFYFNLNGSAPVQAENKISPRLILVDSKGRKWVYLKGNYTTFGADTIHCGSEISGEFASIAEDALGDIWLATCPHLDKDKIRKRGGLWRFNASRFEKVNVSENQSKSLEIEIDPDPGFYIDAKKRLWICSRRGILRIEDQKATLIGIDTTKTRFDIYSKLTEDRNGNLYLVNHRNVFRYDESGKRFVTYFRSTNIPEGHINIVYDKFNHAWFADYHGILVNWDGEEERIYKFRDLGITGNFTIAGYILPTLFLSDKNGDLWFGTSTCGLYQFIFKDKKSKPEVRHFNTNNGLSGSIINDGCIDHAGNLWVLTNYGLNELNIDDYQKTGNAVFRHIGIAEGLHDHSCNNLERDYSGNIWLDAGAGEYYKIDLGSKVKNYLEPHTFLTEISYKNKGAEITLTTLPENLILNHSQNSISISFIGISLSYPEKVRYKYMLEGFDKDWQNESSRNFVSFSNLPAGKYKFILMACNGDGVWNKRPVTFSFEVLTPWYFSWWAIALYIIGSASLLFGYSGYRNRALKARQKELEQTVNERTSEIVKQKQIIEVKNHEITDSINYAQRIQKAILPPLSEISTALPDSFILFKPKDIVSGDFYWFGEKDNRIYIATADCTGHGVPGGFMSMIGTEKLKEALLSTGDVSEMLGLVNVNLKKALRQSGREDSTRDGMDVALCAFDKEMTMLEYAGANRPLLIIRGGQAPVIEEKKATKVAIGGHTDDVQEFAKHNAGLSKGDTVYLFTDGYADQFGRNDKKMMTKKFKELLLSIQDKTMPEQRQFLDSFFEEWKGKMEQTDDVLVIGIKI